VFRVFHGKGGLVLSTQHQAGDHEGDLVVIVREGADHREIHAMLLKVAAWIEGEAALDAPKAE
jgi:hypothetical protein